MITLLFVQATALALPVLCWVRAPRTAHPGAWRLVAVGVALTMLGTSVGQQLAGLTDGPALGGLPGRIVIFLAMIQMLPRQRSTRATYRLLVTLALVTSACVFIGGVLVAQVAEPAGIPALDQFAMAASVASGSLLVGAAALVLSTVAPAGRRSALLVLAAGTTTATAQTSVTLLGHGLPTELVTGCLLMTGTGLLLTGMAVLTDRPAQPTAGNRQPEGATGTRDSSAFGAVAPDVTVLTAATAAVVGVGSGMTLSPLMLGTAAAVALLTLTARLLDKQATDQQDEELRRSEAYFRTLVRSSADAVLIVHQDTGVSWASPSVREVLGLTPEQVLGGRLAERLDPEDRLRWEQALLTRPESDSTAGDEPVVERMLTNRVQRGDGSWTAVEARVRDLRADPDVQAMVLLLRKLAPRPVTGRAPLPAAASVQAVSDPVTGLPNRVALTHRLTPGRTRPVEDPDAASRTRPAPRGTAVILEITGLSTDDDADLVDLVQRLARVLRTDDWLCRPAPDTFVILVPGSAADAETLARRLVRVVRGGRDDASGLTAVAGVVPLSETGGLTALLGDAAVTIRAARAGGPGTVCRHDDARDAASSRADLLRADLVGAAGRGELQLAYQPVFDLVLRRVSSVEALLRWTHPTLGPVPTEEFIELAEETDLILDVQRWVFGTACRTVQALTELPELSVAVNVSARHVLSGELVGDVLAALRSSGLSPARLILEITESVLMDGPSALADLAELRAAGIRVAVDDFGKGWSSLAHLGRLPVDVLKLDRQFLAQIETDPMRRALCRSVLQLGTSLGLQVITEGVETTVELGLLQDMGHRWLQGYLLSRPVPIAALASVVAELESRSSGPALPGPRTPADAGGQPAALPAEPLT